jgi:hypothetical protein
MAKGVQHFTSSGRPYNGKTHKMADGTVHTGSAHTKASVQVFHKGQMPKKPSKNTSTYE